MAKEQHAQKQEKKAPAKTLIEKRLEKQNKKNAKK
jgi:hypothetical protein